jgi:hypothetical protein
MAGVATNQKRDQRMASARRALGWRRGPVGGCLLAWGTLTREDCSWIDRGSGGYARWQMYVVGVARRLGVWHGLRHR